MIELMIEIYFAGDKFMFEGYSKKVGFAYSACVPFTKNEK